MKILISFFIIKQHLFSQILSFFFSISFFEFKISDEHILKEKT